MKMRKVLLTVFSALLIVCLSVGATVAYLTSTDTVTNTFTVGNVKITLDEKFVDLMGNNPAEVATRTDAGLTYKLIPGHSYTKDPTIHVDANSEQCWLFVKVENGLANIEAEGNKIADQLTKHGWKSVTNASNVYYYEKIASASNSYKVFDSFKLADNADVSKYTNATITVTAYAVQYDGFTTAQQAWEATYGAPVSAK